jgi:hypothetical protein
MLILKLFAIIPKYYFGVCLQKGDLGLLKNLFAS